MLPSPPAAAVMQTVSPVPISPTRSSASSADTPLGMSARISGDAAGTGTRSASAASWYSR